MSTATETPATTGSLARRTGAPQWQVRRLIDRLYPDVLRVGPACRLLSPDQAAAVEAELARLGYGEVPADIDPPADWPPRVGRSAEPEDLATPARRSSPDREEADR